MSRKRCPNCRKKVPGDAFSCPRCGHALQLPVESDAEFPETEFLQDPEGSYDWDLDDGDEGIDDPELLERAEAFVRGLPLSGGPRSDMPIDLSEHLDAPRSDRAADGDSAVEVSADDLDEPDTEGGECPVCGRQAQRAWKSCPWCGSPLPGPA